MMLRKIMPVAINKKVVFNLASYTKKVYNITERREPPYVFKVSHWFPWKPLYKMKIMKYHTTRRVPKSN